MKLPNRDRIKKEQILEKSTTYALNVQHPDGQHKAGLVNAKLGINLNNKKSKEKQFVMQSKLNQLVTIQPVNMDINM